LALPSRTGLGKSSCSRGRNHVCTVLFPPCPFIPFCFYFPAFPSETPIPSQLGYSSRPAVDEIHSLSGKFSPCNSLFFDFLGDSLLRPLVQACTVSSRKSRFAGLGGEKELMPQASGPQTPSPFPCFPFLFNRFFHFFPPPGFFSPVFG